MGTSPSIDKMQETDDKFRAYLNGVEADLRQRSQEAAKTMAADIEKFYSTNKYDDAKDFVSGSNTDFMHQSEFSMENVKNIIDSVGAAVFAGASVPTGTTVNKDAVAKATKDMGTQAGSIASLEVYIAGKVFDVLSNVITSFGTSTSMSFSSAVKSESLGYGLQMFTSISASSYESHGFFNNETINQYLYQYDVRFSVKQAVSEGEMNLVQDLSNQLAAFVKQHSRLISDFADGTIDGPHYVSQSALLEDLIAKARAAFTDLSKTKALQAAR